jgi:hypothetical protein
VGTDNVHDERDDERQKKTEDKKRVRTKEEKERRKVRRKEGRKKRTNKQTRGKEGKSSLPGTHGWITIHPSITFNAAVSCVSLLLTIHCTVVGEGGIIRLITNYTH